MPENDELRCVIAAGGTAGHVLPALAVAEALKERGVRVSFAAPPRPETRLLTDSGYDVDLFAVEGIPRELSRRSLRAVGTDVAAPVACRRISVRPAARCRAGRGGLRRRPAGARRLEPRRFRAR